MSSQADFPRSPIRDFDPFGKKSGDNPFADKQAAGPAGNESGAASSESSDNIFAASAALAEPAPPVEYDAVLQPRLLISTSTCGIGFAAALGITLMLVLLPLPSDGRVVYAILFPVAMAFFMAALLVSRSDLRAMRQGAMRREQEALVRGLGLLSGLGLAYSGLMELYCAWPTLMDYFRQFMA